jgi:hypothetical protein
METKAIVMGLVGFLLLYGGLAFCIGVAWYHSKNRDMNNDEAKR